MNKQTVSTALTTGLLAGYGGQSKFEKVVRGSFELTTSHFENSDITYHDEWTNGGGQELVSVGKKMFTRVYAGGALGDIKIIIPKLIYFLQELKDKTRLFTDCSLTSGDWSYQYKIIDTDNNVDVTTGKETILFKNKPVFVHVFVLSSYSQ